jgi:hypothetical protein
MKNKGKGKGKGLDALKLKEKIQAEVFKETAGLSSNEEIDYYRDAAKEGPFSDLFARLEKKDKQRRKAS